MTTAHHTPHPFGGPLTSAAVNSRLSDLDAAIAAAIVTGSGATTALTAQANSGQASLTVASSAGFAPGMSIWIGDPGGTFEVKVVNTVPNGTTITCTTNLANTYTSGKPVSASPIELVDARGGLVSLGARLSLFDRWAYDVRKYGAAGDGTTDDTSAIQAAVDAAAAAGGGLVFVPPGEYRTTASLNLKTGVILVGAGESSTIKVDHTGFGIYAGATSIATGHNLAANATRGTTSVTTSGGGGASYATGDLVVIQSEAQALQLAGHKKADLYRVLSVAGDVVTIEGVLLDSYATADTAKIRKVNTPTERAGVRDLRLYNPRWTSNPTTATNPLIVADSVADFAVDGCILERNNGAGVMVRSVLGARVERCRIEDLRDDTANSIFGYGVVAGHAVRSMVVADNAIRRVRHGFTSDTSNASLLPDYGVPRQVSVVGNVISDCTHAGIDTHEDGDGLSIVGNTIAGCDEVGIQVRCYRVTVAGNTLSSVRGVGIYTRPTARSTVITGNTITGTKLSPSAANGHGILIDSPSVTVTGNLVEESDANGIHVAASANSVSLISGNVVQNNGLSAANTFDGIYIADANLERLTVISNICTDTQSSKTQRYGIRIDSGVTNADGRLVFVANETSGNQTGGFSNASTTAKPTVLDSVGGGQARIDAGLLIRTGVISPAQLTADTHNYDPTGGSSAFMWRLSTDVSRNLTGIMPLHTQGASIRICNIGAANLVLLHDNSSSTGVNRFLCPNGASVTVRPNGSVELVYDLTSTRWRVIAP